LWAIRRRPSIRGWVITEFTDCYWEANGLLDFHRQPKVFHDRFAEIAGPTVLLPGTGAPLVAWSGERLTLPISATHDGPGDLDGAALRWSLGDGPAGREAGASVRIEAGATGSVGVVDAIAPDAPVAATLPLTVALDDRAGVEHALATLDLTVIPAAFRQTANPAPLAVRAPGFEPASLGRLGYRLTDDLGAAALALATHVSDDLLAWVRGGGSLLYTPAPDSVGPFLAVLPRPAPWDGNWISSYLFIKPGTCLSRLPLTNPLGFAYQAVTPRALVVGMGDDEHDDLLGGLLVGWCERLAGTIVQFRVGRGKVLLCTFQLLPALGRDPIAPVMLHDLIDYATSDRFAPRKQAP
jgi:hypothetical protein